jgi:hypothetical protein
MIDRSLDYFRLNVTPDNKRVETIPVTPKRTGQLADVARVKTIVLHGETEAARTAEIRRGYFGDRCETRDDVRRGVCPPGAVVAPAGVDLAAVCRGYVREWRRIQKTQEIHQ